MQRTNVWTPRGEVAGGGGGGVMNWEIGIDMYTLMCIKWITNKNLLYKKVKLKKKTNQVADHLVMMPIIQCAKKDTMREGGREGREESTGTNFDLRQNKDTKM